MRIRYILLILVFFSTLFLFLNYENEKKDILHKGDPPNIDGKIIIKKNIDYKDENEIEINIKEKMVFEDETQIKRIEEKLIENKPFSDETSKKEIIEIEYNIKETIQANSFPKENKIRTFKTAKELLKSCPTEEEIKQIENDFNLVYSDYPGKFTCKEKSKENSIKLTIYNAFRLMKDIHITKSLPWAEEGHTNTYDWLKSLNLNEINFFHGENQLSHAEGYKINIRMNELEHPRYLETTDLQSGVGILDLIILFVHEARHTIPGGNKPHTCEKTKDLTFKEGGAWAVQYQFIILLAEKTENYLSEYDRQFLSYSAKEIKETRFCENIN